VVKKRKNRTEKQKRRGQKISSNKIKPQIVAKKRKKWSRGGEGEKRETSNVEVPEKCRGGKKNPKFSFNGSRKGTMLSVIGGRKRYPY